MLDVIVRHMLDILVIRYFSVYAPTLGKRDTGKRDQKGNMVN